MSRALDMALGAETPSDDRDQQLRMTVPDSAVTVAQELWDAEAWHTLATRRKQSAHGIGALVQLQFAAHALSWSHVLGGQLEAAAQATALIDGTTREASASGLTRGVVVAKYASAVLNNALGRHALARDAARYAFEGDHAGYGPFIVPELAEAAARTGGVAVLASAHGWIKKRCVTPTDWSLGVEARIRALQSDGPEADAFYRQSVEHLRRTRVRTELARTHLLYGEWLRRQHRQVDAREQLSLAREMLEVMGLGAFAERARRELAATGGTVRRRVPEARDDLTPQERQIAGLARDGCPILRSVRSCSSAHARLNGTCERCLRNSGSPHARTSARRCLKRTWLMPSSSLPARHQRVPTGGGRRARGATRLQHWTEPVVGSPTGVLLPGCPPARCPELASRLVASWLVRSSAHKEPHYAHAPSRRDELRIDPA